MNADEKQILELTSEGEGITLEFKECRCALNKNIYETVCAFLNRSGGNLLLGVNDAGGLIGIDPCCSAQIKKDFTTSINNLQKINPACYLSFEEVLIGDKIILRIYVPESSQVHRCNGRIYDRNEDGDFDITDHTRLVSDLYIRKQVTYSENKIYPYAALVDLREDLIARVRKITGVQRKDHPWSGMDDLELLKSAQLYQTDFQTGKRGITLAGILLLGKDATILSVVPHHRTDLLLRKVNLDRYDDRDDVRTNLIESYDRIMAFVAKHLPDPFYLERDQRISIRDAIFREVASNILIHREFLNPFPAKLIIEQNQVRTENSNKPHGFGVINPATFSPFPKNPVIAKFFREIGRADELGSGVRNLMKYGKAFGGREPELVEGDIFKITIGVPIYEERADNINGKSTLKKAQVEVQVKAQVLAQVDVRILSACVSNPLSSAEIAVAMGHKQLSGNLRQTIPRLRKAGYLEYTVPLKPKSRLQKYRLTEKGLEIVKRLKETS